MGKNRWWFQQIHQHLEMVRFKEPKWINGSLSQNGPRPGTVFHFQTPWSPYPTILHSWKVRNICWHIYGSKHQFTSKDFGTTKLRAKFLVYGVHNTSNIIPSLGGMGIPGYPRIPRGILISEHIRGLEPKMIPPHIYFMLPSSQVFHFSSVWSCFSRTP